MGPVLHSHRRETPPACLNHRRRRRRLRRQLTQPTRRCRVKRLNPPTTSSGMKRPANRTQRRATSRAKPGQRQGDKWARLGSNQRPLACEAGSPRRMLRRGFRSRSDSQRVGLVGPPPGDACGPTITSVIGHRCPLAERPTARASPVYSRPRLECLAQALVLSSSCNSSWAASSMSCDATPLPGRWHPARHMRAPRHSP
jgi:hypothetical protein